MYVICLKYKGRHRYSEFLDSLVPIYFSKCISHFTNLFLMFIFFFLETGLSERQGKTLSEIICTYIFLLVVNLCPHS